MNKKCALIVDDSKTARQVLAKKLAAYKIEVETADSAANAIDFLFGNTPDAVFMDYEMPGMDGFQALKIIKSNPQTATIPVMMYTSKEGGIALSQARALGAIGVLPKQMEAEGLDAVIEQLHLHPHQRSLVEKFQDEFDRYNSKATFRAETNSTANVEYLNRPKDITEKVEYPEEVFDESVFVLKRQTRIYQKELMAAEKRILNHISKEVEHQREALHELASTQKEIADRPKFNHIFLYLLTLMVLLLVGYSAWQQYAREYATGPSRGLRAIETEMSDIKYQVSKLTSELQMTEQSSIALEESGAFLDETNKLQHRVEFLSWASNRGTEFQYGENPFDDMRVAWLSEMVSQLNKIGFSGSINLKAHYGNFCLSKSETGALVLASDQLRIEDCIFSADSKQTGFAQSSYQTLGFANYLNSIVSNEDIPIEIFIDEDNFDDPLLPYPQLYSVKTAGAWNRVAAQNQRILVNLYQKMEF